MTPSTISQPVNNASLPEQQGGEFVLKQAVQFSGGDALIGFSASAWSQSPGPMSMQLWLDDQPTDGVLTLYANQPEMHLAMGHSWTWVRGVTPGQHTIMLEAGGTTVTDPNDYACVTVWEMGDGCAVRWAEDAQCPSGDGQELIRGEVLTQGGQLLVSGSSSGWVTQANSFIGAWMPFDGGDPVEMQVFANNAEQHLATVATDMVLENIPRGDHLVQLNADGLTSTDGGDTAHLSVVEWVDPASAPAVLAMNPVLQNSVCDTQDGSGGATIAQSSFTSSGGTLLVRVALSVWTQQSGGYPLYVGIQIDGTSMGFAQVYANVTSTHMPVITNDLVVEGIQAGNHTLNLMAEASVVTDANDRVSVLIMEFPS
jgi:hypothetical protein